MRKYSKLVLASAFLLASISQAFATEDAEQVSAQAAKTYTVKVDAGKNGTVSGKKSTRVRAGSSIEFTVTPSKSYLIDTLTVNGAPSKGLPTKAGKAFKLKISKVNENKTVTVAFTTKRQVRPLSVGSQISVVDAK